MGLSVGTFVIETLLGGAVVGVAGAPLDLAAVAGASFIATPLEATILGTGIVVGGVVGRQQPFRNRIADHDSDRHRSPT
jgi:hypothetical protein